MYIKCMIAKKCSNNDRDFFKLVSRAAFSNPFSEERINLDLKIADCGNDVSIDVRVERTFEKVKERVEKLSSKGLADIGLYKGEERIIMESSFIFEVFHIFSKHFDKLISNQIEAEDEPCSVAFAKDAIRKLIDRGFSTDKAQRLFALLYQLKRAYYFVDKGLVGASPSMKKLKLHLWNNVFTYDLRLYERYLWNHMEDFSTLLLGETGTGKGTAAAAIGRSGFIPFDVRKGCFQESFTRNFISINLSLYPESLIESELFGHKKGSFTGAIGQHEGIFSRCSPHGAILLDEIGDISLTVQLKLLQLLQERTFSAVGSHEKMRFNGRVIAATNRSLDELRKEGHFRDDFYYRLCSDCILVPTLRQRLREDAKELDLILDYIIIRLTGEESKELVEMVKSALKAGLKPDYSWPGNVRELEQAVRRILLSREYSGDADFCSLSKKDLLHSKIDEGEINAQDLLSLYCSILYERHGTFEEVSRRLNLDRRTVKKYVEMELPIKQ